MHAALALVSRLDQRAALPLVALAQRPRGLAVLAQQPVHVLVPRRARRLARGSGAAAGRRRAAAPRSRRRPPSRRGRHTWLASDGAARRAAAHG